MAQERWPVLQTTLRLLTFRASREELEGLDNRHLAFGLLCTWLVGIGRYWDNADIPWPLRLGVGSLVYVVFLSGLLWFVIKPVTYAVVSYRRLLTFVTLTSPPGLIYAIPVEMMFSSQVARNINFAFLGIVATWRVALLFFYLKHGTALTRYERNLGVLIVLDFIAGPVAVMGGTLVLMGSMAGIQEPQYSSTNQEQLTLDGRILPPPPPPNHVLQVLGIIAFWTAMFAAVAFLPMLSAYCSRCMDVFQEKRRIKEEKRRAQVSASD